MKSRKYRKSRKNYKRVKRGGQASDYEPRLSEYEPRGALSYDGPMNMTLDPDYQRIDRTLNYNKYNQNAQRNQLERGMNKDRLSQLTRLNAFQSLAPDQQKAFVTTFMNSDTQKQDEIINYYKLLSQTNESQDIKKLKNKQQFTKLSPEDKTEVIRAYLALPEDEKENFLNFFTGGKTKKRRRNKKTRGGGECTDKASLNMNDEGELNNLKHKYCTLKKLGHQSCCNIIKGHLNTLQKSKGIIEKDIQNKYPSEESKKYSFDDYTEFPPPRDK